MERPVNISKPDADTHHRDTGKHTARYSVQDTETPSPFGNNWAQRTFPSQLKQTGVTEPAPQWLTSGRCGAGLCRR